MGVQGHARKNRPAAAGPWSPAHRGPRPAPPPLTTPSPAPPPTSPPRALGRSAQRAPQKPSLWRRDQRRPRAGSGCGGAGPAAAARLPQLVSPEPAELGPRPRAPRASASADPAAPQTQGTAALSPPTHLEDPWNTSFGPVPPASTPIPASSPALLGSPSVPQEVTETPLASASSPAPGPAPPEDPVTQGGPGTPREDAAGPSPGSTRGASAHPWVAAPPGSTTSSRSRSAELLGTGESTSEPFGSGSSAGPQTTTARRKGVAPSQAARPETPGSRPEPETGARPLASLGVGDTALAPGSSFGETKP
ncbi:hypothetical protein J1605_018526 [Eschrichtius robustus]|uniref:Uncharacterized protein n=1 Tax=Eschrichtius robustus TaxID=9764 RepID=A0AB34HW28_ESCRO|nr:hypothetical protein J1605_018526 [Eschrichtius robustus]